MYGSWVRTPAESLKIKTMIELWNPKWYWYNTFTKYQQEQATNLIDALLLDKSLWTTQPDWSRFSTGKSSTTYKNGEILIEKFLDIVNPSLQQFVNEMPMKQKVDIKLESIWLNKYDPNENQEFHNHASKTCNISMVYFHRNAADSFHFFDANWFPNRMSSLDTVMNLPSHEVITPNFKVGDILLFPSHYGHYVTPNPTQDIRVTVSGNLNIVPVL